MAKRPQERFVIKHPQGGYFTGVEVVGYKDSIEPDTGKRELPKVYQREVMKPQFHAFLKDHAARYATREDCDSIMKHDFLHDPKAFEGCSVESEFDD